MLKKINLNSNAEISSFSVTDVKLALSCPRIFIFSKYYHKKPFPYTGLVLGSIIHDILNKTVNKLKNNCNLKDFLNETGNIDIKKFENELREFAYSLFYPKLVDFQNKFPNLSEIEKNIQYGWNLIEKGLEIIISLLSKAFELKFDTEAFSKVFLANERSFKIKVPQVSENFVLTGRIDSLWMDLKSNEAILIDFKTGPIEFLPTDISQLTLYAYAVHQELNFKPKFCLFYLTQDGIIEKEVQWIDMESILPNIFEHIIKMQQWVKEKKNCIKTTTPRLCLTCHLYKFCKKHYPNDPPPSKENFKYFKDSSENLINADLTKKEINQQVLPQKSIYNNSNNIGSPKIKQESLYIGNLIEKSNEEGRLEIKHLNRHIAILGNPGSGKTVLSKVIIEELLLQGYSSILIDPQGDLCSLLLPNDEIGNLLSKTINFKILTPGSKKGIPLTLDMFEAPDPLLLNDEDYINMLLDNISTNILNIIGIEVKKGIPPEKTLLESTIQESWFKNQQLDFRKLAKEIDEKEEVVSISTKERIPINQLINSKKKDQLVQKLITISAGTEGFLFSIGQKFNIQELIDSGPSCYIINLQSLGTDQNKRQLVLSWILRQIYNWMLTHPQADQNALRLFFYIDEVADFLPIHPNNPPSKKMLILLLRQARKYGIGIMIATQSPGSIEYKALDNINTFLIGKTPTPQSAKKISDLISPYLDNNPLKLESAIKKIQKSNTGEFFVIHPGQLSKTFVKVRWLHTKHETISLDRIKTLIK